MRNFKLIYLFHLLFLFNLNLILCKKYIVRNICASIFGNVYSDETNKIVINENEDNTLFSNNISTIKHIGRIAQVLFNDLLESIEINEKEEIIEDYIKIKCKKYYYFDNKIGSLNNEYWINKKHLQSLDDYFLNKYSNTDVVYSDSDIKIKKQKDNKEIYRYEDLYNEKNKGVLIRTIYLEGKYEDKYYKFFLPGTEFEFFESKKYSNKFVVFYNDFRDRTKKIEIDKDAVILYSEYKQYKNNINLMRKLFLKLLYSWIKQANAKGKIMPYVWGGTSIGIPLDLNFICDISLNNGDIFYGWKDKLDGTPIGCDCSGLICCASQIIGFPFYLRNSTTQRKYLFNIKKGESILEGDILWIPGHVFILDPENDCCIESSGYSKGDKGLGVKLLSERFEDIFSTKDLENKYFNNREPLILIDKFGDKKKIVDYEILSLSSCYLVNYN